MAFVALAVLLVVVARGARASIELAVALVAVAVVLVTGALTLDVVGDTLDQLAPTLGFLVAVFVITEVARDAGLFRAAGELVDRHASGVEPRRCAVRPLRPPRHPARALVGAVVALWLTLQVV